MTVVMAVYDLLHGANYADGCRVMDSGRLVARNGWSSAERTRLSGPVRERDHPRPHMPPGGARRKNAKEIVRGSTKSRRGRFLNSRPHSWQQ